MLRIVLALLLLLSGCAERDSNYEALVSLDGKQKLEKFRDYPLSERMRLYNKVYENSGHPPDTTLAEGFDDKPAEAFSYILSDLQESSIGEFMRYVPVFYSIADDPNFDICQPERIGRLAGILDSYNLDRRQRAALAGMSFRSVDSCRQFRQRLN